MSKMFICTIVMFVGSVVLPSAQHPTRPIDLESTEAVFKVVSEMPRFPGCEDLSDDPNSYEKYQCAQEKFLDYINSNMAYPDSAIVAGVEGRVVVQFIVEKDSIISNVQCIRDIGYGCGAEVVRVIDAMNQLPEKWTPGKQRGIPVRVLFTFPFTFTL